MPKKVVILTQSQMNHIIQESIEKVQTEISLGQAVEGREYNIMANDDYKQGHSKVTFGKQDKSTSSRIGKSQKIQYDLLNKSLKDNLGELPLYFVQEANGGNNSAVIFFIESILLLNEAKNSNARQRNN